MDHCSSIKHELEKYVPEAADKTADPLSWWKARQLLYVKNYLAIPTRSVSAERIFSMEGNLVTKKRVQLSAENINLLIFLNKNA